MTLTIWMTTNSFDSCNCVFLLKKLNWSMRVLLPWLIVFSSFIAASSETANRFSFTIKPGDEGAHAVKVATTEGELVTCSFRFSTRRRSSNDDESRDSGSSTTANVRRPSAQSVLGRLSGICIRRTIDYWKYELCFEGEIKQLHGQVQHNMGRYSGLEGPIQLYDEGTPCESRSENRGRRTKVEFLCDRQLRIRSVEEVATCTYLVSVGTPIVCGSSEFAVAPSEDDTEAGMQQLDELWMLEVAQLAKSKVECSVRALTGDVRAKPERPQLTTLEFSRFDLEVSLSPESSSALAHDLHVARAPDRVRLSISEREYSLPNPSVRAKTLAIKSGDSFQGLLEFVQLLVRFEQ